MARLLKACNVLNAMAIAAVGVTTFILVHLTVLVVLSAIYVICFSLLLLFFECHLSRFDMIIRNNFGFMFKWPGRVIFFFFSGSLCFGLGIFGIVIGCVTCANVLFNLWAICMTPGILDKEKKAQELVEARMGNNMPPTAQTVAQPVQPIKPVQPSGHDDRNPFTTDVTIGVAGHQATVPVSVSVNDIMASNKGDLTGEQVDAGWVKQLDSNTGKYYYYNNRTNEMRWDLEGL